MPSLSRLAIRLSLLYLVLGGTLGMLILIQKASTSLPWAWMGLTAHMELMLVGWMTQFALGIAFWILPRLAGSAPRGNEIWSRLAFGLLNLGLGIFCIASLFSQSTILLAARLLEVFALIAFGLGNWSRIRSLSALRGRPRSF